GTGGPAGLPRRPQMSDEIKSVSCQSGPFSRSTTFLPALVRTLAKTEPEAPAPTMTTSTFSLLMSPPRRRSDVGHVRHAERGIAFHGGIGHIDCITAQDAVDKGRGR